MKVLLTGGSGFLGKHLLSSLLSDERIERIDVISRTKSSHPHSKVRLIPVDLTDPSCKNEFSQDVDVVIHLAGLYDFSQSYTRNYQQNVLATLNVTGALQTMNALRPVPIFYASTYAVGFGLSDTLGEKPLEKLPSKKIAYVYTKALAEKIITDSGIPSMIFRLGILVGTENQGEIEKLDGPYAFLRVLKQMARTPLCKKTPVVPVPARKKGVLPLVPVDCAARIFHQALFKEEIAVRHESMGSRGPRIFGLYNSDSVTLEDFCNRMVKQFLPQAKPVFINGIPQRVLKFQKYLTHVPGENFQLSMSPVPLENAGFNQCFSENQIPHFMTFEKNFLRGFYAFA